MLNVLLHQEGYAQVMTIPPNIKYQDLFLKLERLVSKEKDCGGGKRENLSTKLF
jgi:micrococcal nuclease